MTAVLQRMELAKQRFTQPNGAADSLIEIAYSKVKKEEERYQRMLAIKKGFLKNEDLEPICTVTNAQPTCLSGIKLPTLPFGIGLTFRAELYRHKTTHKGIVVFRGTQGGADWISNAWLAVDLLGTEAPHYEAARIVTAQFVKDELKRKNTLPIVVGHSLGGGMAQYVGYGQNLNVVAFNSSPLPSRYIPKKLDLRSQHIRVYSAVEFRDDGPKTIGIPDPVSLFTPNASEVFNEFAKYELNEQFGVNFEPIKAHVHLVPPICIRSVPSPFLSPEEDADVADVINGMYSRSLLKLRKVLVSKDMNKMAEYVAQRAILESADVYLKDAVWLADSASKYDKDVADYAKLAVTGAAVDIYKAASSIGTIGSIVYNMAVGSSSKAVKDTVKPMLSAAKQLALKRIVMAHSMGRFNRGMEAILDTNVFGAQVSSAQCLRPISTNKFR